MSQKVITITVTSDVGLTGREIAKMIERCTGHSGDRLEITATPTTIDIRFEKQFSDIDLSPQLVKRLKEASKRTGVSIEDMLTHGARRYGEKV